MSVRGGAVLERCVTVQSSTPVARSVERAALVVALLNALVVYLLPLAFATTVSFFATNFGNSSTRVVGVDPDRAVVWSRRIAFVGAYLTMVAPLAFAAAWRTFVHARRWLAYGRRGVIGIGEGAVCGFAAAVLVLLPGIVTSPTRAPGFVLAYGGLASVIGLAVGAILWVTATVALHIYRRRAIAVAE